MNKYERKITIERDMKDNKKTNKNAYLFYFTCLPIRQAMVGPTTAPFVGTSARPPVKRSMSSM